jgi:hypothetical protein
VPPASPDWPPPFEALPVDPNMGFWAWEVLPRLLLEILCGDNDPNLQFIILSG